MNLPLSEIRVLDLTVVMAGPYFTLILEDLGAEVIKIEGPDVGEPSRGMPPYFFEEESAYFIAMNRNKKSLALDLKSDMGKQIFHALAEKSDVVVDNFRPGVVGRLGLDLKPCARSIRGSSAVPFRDTVRAAPSRISPLLTS